MKNQKRHISIFLILVMLLTQMVPLAALAEEAAVPKVSEQIYLTATDDMVDDNHASFVYDKEENWELNTTPGASGRFGGTLRQAKVVPATMDIYFEGQGITVYTTKFSSGGMFEAYVDDELQGSYNNYDSAVQLKVPACTITGLTNTKHKLTIKVTSTYVEVDAAKVPTPAAAPTASPAAGTYSDAQQVTLSSATAGAAIHYTTDGSAPTASSALYAGSISVPHTMTIKAVAVGDGFLESEVASFAYTVTDAAAPTIVSVQPETTGKISGILNLTFNEEMNSTAGTVALVAGDKSIPVTVHPTGADGTGFAGVYTSLAYETEYTVEIQGFKDVTGNMMQPDTAHKFTTGTAAENTAVRAYDPETGRLSVDYESFLSEQDLVYKNLPQNAEIEGMPVANGRTGASVWHDNGGIRMQIHSVDNTPNSAFGTAQVKLTTAPALTGKAFEQRLNLYDGNISIRQDNGFEATVFGIPGTETMGIHVVDRRENARSASLEIELWDLPDQTIHFGGTNELDAWKTIDYFNEDGIVGFTKGVSTKEPFGYAFAATVDGAEGYVMKTSDKTAKIYINAEANEAGVREYTVWMSAASRYHLPDACNATAQDTYNQAKAELQKAKALGYASAMAEFKTWWHSYWERSFIAYDDATANGSYMENFYYLTQYHLGGASDATFPMHFMKGVYKALKDDDTQWNIGYWHFNQRAVYSGALASNHAEMFARHLDFYDGVKNEMTEYTRQRFGYADAMKTTETMRWDGYPKKWPLNENPDYNLYTMFDNDYVGWIYSTGPEVAENMYYAYKYSMDKEVLAQYYDYMKRTVSFIVQWARWDEASGMYHLDNSNSLENWWKINNATPDNAGARSILPKYLEAATILGKTEEDAALIAKATDVLAKLEPITVVKNENRYAAYDIYDKVVGNCNMQNPELEGVYPHNVMGLDYPDYETAVNTFARKDHGLNIWSVCGVQSARLGLGDQAESYAQQMIQKNQKRVTGFTDDGNGKLESMGYHIATVNEMYLQSYDDLIRVFPAAPTNQAYQGAFTLLASGGFLVSSEFKEQAVQYISLLSQHGGKATVKIPWAESNAVLLNGEEVPVTDGRLCVETVKDGKYLIEPLTQKGFAAKTETIGGTRNTTTKTAFGRTLGIAGTGTAEVVPTDIGFDFNLMEGNQFKDTTANNNVATANKAVTIEERDEHNGKALVLKDGAYLQVPHSDSFNPVDNFIFSMDVKRTVNAHECLFDKSAPLGEANSTGFYMDIYGGNLRVIYGSTVFSYPLTNEDLQIGKWATIRVEYSSTLGMVDLYLDNVKKASKKVSEAVPVVIAPGRIGTSRLNGQAFTGSIDNFRIQPMQIADVAPIEHDDVYAVKFNQAKTIFAPGVLGNDTDEAPSFLTAELQSLPQHGKLVFMGDGCFIYTPEVGFSGKDNFTYRAYDKANQASEIATVTLEVGLAAIPTEDQFSVLRGETLRGSLTVNDVTSTGKPLSGTSYEVLFCATDESSECPVTLNSDGNFTYKANLPTLAGVYSDEEISFSYQIRTKTGRNAYLSEPATATIKVGRSDRKLGLCYDFKELNSDGKVPDISGKNNHGTPRDVTITPEGTAKFDGAGSIRIENSESFDLTDNFVLSMRVKANGAATQTLFDKANVPGSYVTSGLYIDTYGRNLRIFSDVATLTSLPAPFTIDKFTEVNLVYSTALGKLQVYYDGKFQGETSIMKPLPMVLSHGVIGTRLLSASAAPFTGEIDDFSLQPLTTGITMEQTKISLAENSVATLTAKALPENAFNQFLTWSTGDPSVATVSPAGVVSALKAGKTTITATTVNGYAAICELTVNQTAGGVAGSMYTLTAKQSVGGKISPTSASVEKGKSQTFTIAADTGYSIKDVLVDGKSVGAVKTYTFTNVTVNHTITAVFEKLSSTGFVDVKDTDWFADEVKWAVEKGIMNGVGEEMFKPNGKTSRAMVLTMLYRQAGSPKATGGDVWYADAQKWAIAQGVSDGSDIAGEITREQLVTMLWRANGSPKAAATKLDGFADSDMVSDYAREAMSWAIEKGILTGKGQNNLDPTGTATRAETAAMFMRLSNLH